MIFQLQHNNLLFPDPSLAVQDGFLAIGGDLQPERLINAYQHGIFPWYSQDDPICWYAPHERCVLFPQEINISRSMKKLLARNTFEIKINTAFEAVVQNCKSIKRKDGQGTWITHEMNEAYVRLHKMGKAHSIEAWKDGELAGGMYGVEVNEVFCGESMFSKISNASKTVVIWLCKQSSYKLIDCQMPNPHLMSLGARMIPQKEFLARLQNK